MNDIPDERFLIKTREDLARYLNKLSVQVEGNPDGIENPASADLIEAAAAWLDDTQGRIPGRGIALDELNPWQIVAIIISAGLIYE